jgi:hypothetical protein
VRERERECVYTRERESVCVYERERERERERKREVEKAENGLLAATQNAVLVVNVDTNMLQRCTVEKHGVLLGKAAAR